MRACFVDEISRFERDHLCPESQITNFSTRLYPSEPTSLGWLVAAGAEGVLHAVAVALGEDTDEVDMIEAILHVEAATVEVIEVVGVEEAMHHTRAALCHCELSWHKHLDTE